MYARIIVTLFIVGFSSLSFGQLSINGRVTDTKQPLPFATVLLLNADSSLAKGVISDTEGRFSFENIRTGNYKVSSSMIGYKSFTSNLINITTGSLTLPDIVMEESATELSEVVVQAEKPLFEQQMDRLVVNVENRATSSGNSVLEVLQKSPGILVNKQNNSIGMNGKSGVRLMINNKLVQVPMEVAMQMLDGMSASNVEKIELINTPPSRYDADGNAGIIHIVTKETPDMGTNGSVGVTIGAHAFETLGANLNLNHRSKKTAWSVDYAALRNHNLHTSDLLRYTISNPEFSNTSDQNDRENLTIQQNLNAALQWTPIDNTTLDFGVTAYSRNWELNSRNGIDVNTVSPDSTVITRQQIKEQNHWKSATASIGLETKLSSQSRLSAHFDYLFYRNDNPSTYDNTVHYQQRNLFEAGQIDLQKETPIHFYVAKIDYQVNFSPRFTLEAGAKGVTSHLKNDVLVHRLASGQWLVDPAFTSRAKLDEQVVAGYLSSNWSITKQWLLTSGVRYEYTQTAIHTPEQRNLINRKYGYFFPSIVLKKDLQAESDIQLSLSRRITRPTYNDIAPYVFFWGPNTFSSGNVSLYPSISNVIRVGYHLRNWSVAAHFTHANREINSYQPETDRATQNLIYRSQNLKYLNTSGLTNTYSIQPTNWWEVQATITAQFQTARTAPAQNNLTFHLFSWNVNASNTIKLPRNYSVEISGFYQSRSLVGIAEWLPMASLNAGIQKKFERSTVTLSMDDILYNNLWRANTHSPANDFHAVFNYDFHNQFIRINYSYNLGNQKLRSVKMKSGADEERGRIN